MFDLDKATEFAEGLYKKGAMLCHGAAIACQGQAIILFAPSGTGKTTLEKFWLEAFPSETEVINDDKPIITMDDPITVSSSPLCGKEGLKNDDLVVPLKAIILVKRGDENSIRKVDPSSRMEDIFNQIYRPKNPMAMGISLEMIDALFKTIDLYELHCRPEIEAAILAHDTIMKA